MSSVKVCYVCGDSADGRKSLCTKCSKTEARVRSGLIQHRLSALSEQRAENAALRTRLQTNSRLGALAAEAEARTRVEVCRARVEALRKSIELMRERTEKGLVVISRKQSFLDQKAAALTDSRRSLDEERVRAGVLAALVRSMEARNRRLGEELMKRRRRLVSGIASFITIAPSPKNRALESVVVNVALPNSGNYADVDPAALSAALGHILHVIGLLCKFLSVAPSVSWRLMGAFSCIWLHNRTDQPQQFPLFFERVVEDLRGVQLVNDLIAFVASTQGIEIDPEHERCTLPNLIRIIEAVTGTGTGSVTGTGSGTGTLQQTPLSPASRIRDRALSAPVPAAPSAAIMRLAAAAVGGTGSGNAVTSPKSPLPLADQKPAST